MSTLTIIVPVYNEEKFVIQSLERLNKVSIVDEVIVVDDCSTDNSYKLVSDYIVNKKKYKLIQTLKNSGKGQAIAAAQTMINSDYVGIHDADLEYYPEDLVQMYKYINNNQLVLGSRFIGEDKRSNIYKRTLFANFFLSKLFSIIYRTKITDIATCYKMMPTEFFKNYKIKSSGFEFEVEVLANFLKSKNKIYEVPIKYKGRSYSDGKKIKTLDGFKYIYWMIKSKL